MLEPQVTVLVFKRTDRMYSVGMCITVKVYQGPYAEGMEGQMMSIKINCKGILGVEKCNWVYLTTFMCSDITVHRQTQIYAYLYSIHIYTHHRQ